MKLEVCSIRCMYGIMMALDGVSVSVESGELVGVLGPNGSGKSTLVRAMAGSLRPVAGRVLLDGQDTGKMSPRAIARKIAVVPQNGHDPFSFSVTAIVLMGRAPHLGRFSSESADDVQIAIRSMDAAGVSHLASRPVTQLSFGERQRVIIARALAQEPGVLLLDEPTSHLDPRYQVDMMDLFWSLSRREGLAVIAVLHDINLASQYCDRIVMLKKGRQAASGTPGEVVTPTVLEDVYGVKAVIQRHPLSHCPQALLVSEREVVHSPLGFVDGASREA